MCPKTGQVCNWRTNPSAEGDGRRVGADIFQHDGKLADLHHLISALWQMQREQLEHFCADTHRAITHSLQVTSHPVFLGN